MGEARRKRTIYPKAPAGPMVMYISAGDDGLLKDCVMVAVIDKGMMQSVSFVPVEALRPQ